MSGVITLTTDFGTDDTYVGVLKGVILRINPQATIVDLCHSIQPHNIAQAAFLVNNSFRYFPWDSIHLVVVDPGVGTSRRAIILQTQHPPATFVAPDNGLLSSVVAERLSKGRQGAVKEGFVFLKELGQDLQAFDITNSRLWLSPVSPSFHARDIFAPVVAQLSLGLPPKSFGRPVPAIAYLPPPLSVRDAGGSLKGCVAHIDRFGNLVTNIREEDLPKREVGIEVCGHNVAGVKRTYAEGTGLLALIGSSGYLEIAVNSGSAAKMLHAEIGDEVAIRPV